MKKIFISCCFCIFLISCATQKKYEENLNTWLGSSENDVIATWGIPDGSYDRIVNNRKTKYLIYNSMRNQYVPDVYTQHQGLTGSFVSKFCKTMFAIDIENDEVASWKYDGNDCVSR